MKSSRLYPVRGQVWSMHFASVHAFVARLKCSSDRGTGDWEEVANLEDNRSLFLRYRPLDERLKDGFVPELYRTSIGIGGGGGRRHDHRTQPPGNKRTLSFAPETEPFKLELVALNPFLCS